MRELKRTLVIIFSSALTLFSVSSWGASDVVDSRSTCTTINCSSARVDGSIQGELGKLVTNDNWIYQAYCGAGECCRFDITNNRSSDALVLTVVGADVLNSIYQPQVALNPTVAIEPPRPGPYTIIVGTRLETSDVPGVKKFTLRYGRYSPGNPNCANITPNMVAP